MKILLTGFEPFGGRSTNPSQAVVEALCHTRVEGVDLHTAVLPVEHVRGPQALLGAFNAVQPQAVVCLGEAGGRARISLERLAINLMDDRLPDNAGEQKVDQPIVPGGPAAYFTTLPVKRMREAILQAGVPAELSLTAGAFLCNQVTYVLLHHLAQHQISIPAGFIHLPLLPEQAAEQQLDKPETGPVPSMCLDSVLKGVQAALSVLSTHHVETRVAG